MVFADKPPRFDFTIRADVNALELAATMKTWPDKCNAQFGRGFGGVMYKRTASSGLVNLEVGSFDRETLDELVDLVKEAIHRIATHGSIDDSVSFPRGRAYFRLILYMPQGEPEAPDPWWEV